MTNRYNELVAWEKWATQHLPGKFGLNVLEVCNDYKRNHDEGTDAITWELGRVDFKWNRIFDYKKIFFALEDRSKNGETWVENEKALEYNVVILHPWKDYTRDGYYKLAGYSLNKLKDMLNEKRKTCRPEVAKWTGTRYYRVEMEELEDKKIWDSGWVFLKDEEKAWANMRII